MFYSDFKYERAFARILSYFKYIFNLKSIKKTLNVEKRPSPLVIVWRVEESSNKQ